MPTTSHGSGSSDSSPLNTEIETSSYEEDYNMNLNLAAFQEPRGFIKLIQIVFAIISFATTCDFRSTLSIAIKCSDDTSIVSPVSFPIAYPFNLPPFTIKTPSCHENQTLSKNYITIINLDNVSKAEFFVTIGVLAFIYAIAASAVYALFSETYSAKNSWPIVDLVCSIFLTFMFFVSSIAWSTGVSSLKMMTDADTFRKAISPMENSESFVLDVTSPSYAKLTVSLITGYFNIILWGASIWFVYKETEYHTPKPFRPTAATLGGERDIPTI